LGAPWNGHWLVVSATFLSILVSTADRLSKPVRLPHPRGLALLRIPEVLVAEVND
jgi:hypothetical protein